MKKEIAALTLAAGLALAGGATIFAETAPAVDPAAVDKAFETLKTYDWGADRSALAAIDQAIVASHGNDAARSALEGRLLAVLTGQASRSAKDFVCRRLRTVGTAQSVPALAALLADEEMSHMARFALERIQDETAAAAMRAMLPQPLGKRLSLFRKPGFTESKLKGNLAIGVIGSLGARGDAKSIPSLANLLGDKDAEVACAAAQALGLIGTPQAADALKACAAGTPPKSLKPALADASLACAEKLLNQGEKSKAADLYRLLKGADQPKHVQVAATKGLLTVTAAK